MRRINVRTVACCGANELIAVDDLVGFLEANSNVEVGIGVSLGNCQVGTLRFDWIESVLRRLPKIRQSNVALHVNGRWSIDIVKTGKMPDDLRRLLEQAFMLTRVQLNFAGSGYLPENECIPTFVGLIESLKADNLVRFIVPYNEPSAEFVSELVEKCSDFDILYDASFGLGRQSEKYLSLFPAQFQGYAGGLDVGNIEDELAKINRVQSQNVDIWIDAEGKLRNDRQKVLDLCKAQKFIDRINSWQNC